MDMTGNGLDEQSLDILRVEQGEDATLCSAQETESLVLYTDTQ